MPDAPKPELLHSLGRLVRGLSALFWGLPLSLLVCVQSAKMDWLLPFNIFPAPAATGLLLFGLLQVGGFQKQERQWRRALDRAKLVALVNCGLSPFLFWWNRMPDNAFFSTILGVLAVSGVVFLFNLNLVLLRLGDMLPDAALRQETRQFTRLNRNLLILLLLITGGYFALAQVRTVPQQFAKYLTTVGLVTPWLMLILILLPLAMSMALIWKAKEVVLDGVFGAK